MKYIAKIDTWYDQGTEVELLDDFRPLVDSGIFCGYRKGKLDEEICSFGEFEIVEEEESNDKHDKMD